MLFLKSSVKSALTMVHASSSALNEVKPFRMNLKMMCLLVSLAAKMSCQLSTGAGRSGFWLVGSSRDLVAGFNTVFWFF